MCQFYQGRLLLQVTIPFEEKPTSNLPGDNLRYYRQRKSLTTRQLAEQIDVVPATILMYERNKHPIPFDVANSLADALDVNADLLYDDFAVFLVTPCSEALKDIRMSIGMSQRAFAEHIGVIPSYYYTLDSLRGELYMCDMPNLAQMVETLSELFRYSISQKEPLISLEAEIDNTEKYIRIMQFRFPNKFVLYKRFDDETDEILGMQVPKMILQPIVENSINHGLEAKIGPGRIFIDITHTERTVCIRVDDDGVGIPADKLDSINTQLSKNESNCAADSVRGMGLALFNINSRIRLLYGEDYGVSVASSVGKGTQVQIMLPLSKE